MFSAGSLQTLDLLKSIVRVETECSKELPDYLLRQNFDIELPALPPEIFRRQLEGVSKFRGKECYFHKLEKQKAKKCGPRFLFRTCSHTHISFTSTRSHIYLLLLPDHLCDKCKKFPVKGVIFLKSPGLFCLIP